MTFINRRIIKRPTLFATSRRNFGNLLTHYETGQDGTTPDPDPTPDPVTFTTSWSTNGGIVEANLTGISSHRTTEVIVLTRSNGTVLATLDENKVGDWDLQHDEGTGYGSYTYNIRLDGVIKSTFSRDYQPNVPSFTTNFFSNSAKTISCGVENITNPSGLFTVQLARIDGAVLDSHVLNDATSFFLQFTELDYGTYDYQVLLNDTQVATHQHIFVRPEPTFTTSWTKSGLAISADLSSIVGAHPDFYAYLCRDDGTTLATHQFQTGQTTTSLSFTEADYGTFTYQLKLGTTVVSTHTETYVRPTPTYTASFSTNELTLTASITSITNAHNSFAITLERDDGTVIQTHTLVNLETSFTFTQTETSYTTFNYVVKLNGTQTDAYSATYSPPPTPTFGIALTNDDLAITATLTNIVNPDSYYTLMIHDVNDTHLDGHTFATGDTTVVLTWTETSYGEKTYTKLLNGASIGTETITLTDTSTPTAIEPQTLPKLGGSWGPFEYKETIGTYHYYSSGWDTDSPPLHGTKVQSDPNASDHNIWSDSHSGHDPTSFIENADGTVSLYNPNNELLFKFTKPTEASWISTPAVPQPTLVNTISITGGAWNTATYDYVNTDVNNTYYEYGLSIAGDQVKENYYIAYNWTTRKWFDTQPTNHHNTFGTSSTDLNTTSRETTENPAVLYVFDTSPRFTAQFTNPYYEAIEPQTITPTTVNPAWGGATYIWIQTVGTSEIYTLAFGGVATNNNHEIQVDTITNTWSDYGTNNPNTVTDNGSTVTLSSGTTTFVVFNKPTSASWL